MRLFYLFFFGLLSFTKSSAQTDSLRLIYVSSFEKLSEILERDGSFKEAVFVAENAFTGNQMYFDRFNTHIQGLSQIAQIWMQFNSLKGYRFKDSSNLHKNLAVFKILTDTIRLSDSSGKKYHLLPFSYDFNDFFGKKDWGYMFVSKLLVTKSGNCRSLPYLYKILADELGATCWLSLAPNHLYVKNRSVKIGWYNTELTSRQFPIDAWITASGYIPIKAVQNGIYMDTLSNRQAIALCVLDLAKGYEFQTKNYEDGFILKCIDLVLKYHPTNVQAMLLKAETLKRVFESQRHEGKSDASDTFKEMEQLYAQLLDLGYREMPEEMYLNWLMSITQESKKYQNNKVLEAMK